MLGHAGLFLLFALVGCAGASAPPADVAGLTPAEPRFDPASLLLTLARFSTEAEMRADLEAGLEDRELRYVGFDQVTIAQSIDRVVSAFLEDRRRPGDPLVRARLADSADLYFAAKREAMVRRYAGKASCLPDVR